MEAYSTFEVQPREFVRLGPAKGRSGTFPGLLHASQPRRESSKKGPCWPSSSATAGQARHLGEAKIHRSRVLGSRVFGFRVLVF